LNVGLVSTLRPTLINEARFVFYRFVTATSDNSSVPGVIHPDGTQTGADFCCPQGGLQKRYQYIDNLTWSHGAHTSKVGFNISYYPWNSLFPQFHFGQYLANAADNGAVNFTVAFGPGEVTSKDNIYGFYVQDTWKLTRKLTVNAGLRWDYEAGAFKGGKIPGPNGTCLQGNGLISACSSDKNNFQPRLGFTYALGNKTLIRAGFAETTMLAFNNVVLDSLNFDGTTLFTVTIDGSTPAGQAVLNAFPNAPSPALLAPFAPANPANFGRIRPIADNLRNPEMRMVNFGIERQFTNTLKGGIQYIGQFGFGLFGERDTNAPPVLPDPAHPDFFFYGPRPDASFGAIRTNENSRTSHYNGLVVSTNKTFTHHVQFNASYTWSHATASSEDFFGISEPGDFRTISTEMGPAFNDVRHAANMGVVLDSGKLTSNRFAAWVANNMGFSWVGQIQSGRPYPLSTGDTSFGDGSRFFGAGSETQQRPNVLSDGTISVAGIGSAGGVIGNFGPNAPAVCITAGNPAAICNSIQNTFLAPCNPNCSPGPIDFLTGDFVDFKQASGSLERNAARGSPFVKFDASLHKQFTVHENVKLEFRFDAFNVFNHTNWTSFNSNDVLTALGFSFDPNCVNCQRLNGTFAGNTGQTLHISDLRQGKISSDFTNQVFGGLGDPAADDAPRRLQLSFHVRF
jgi:hypothetical protein